MYDRGFMDNTNRQAVKNWLDSQTRDASLTSWRQPFCKKSSQFLTAWRLVLSMKPWSYIWLEIGLFSTIIAIIRSCACWALFVVTLTNTVHLTYIYIYIYIWERQFKDCKSVLHTCLMLIDQRLFLVMHEGEAGYGGSTISGKSFLTEIKRKICVPAEWLFAWYQLQQIISS